MRVYVHRRCQPTGRILEQTLSSLTSDWVLNWGRQTGDFGERVINPPDGVLLASEKVTALQTMAAQGAAVPEVFTDVLEAHTIVDDRPLVGRTTNHRAGSGFWLCNNREEVARSALRGATHWMPFIPHVEHEYRVHVFNGKVIKTSEKLGGTGFIRTHRHGWAFRNPILSFDERQPIRKAARKAVRSLTLDFGAVDLLQDHEGGIWILEVNTAPSLTSSTSSTLRAYLEAIQNFTEVGREDRSSRA